ncbi:HD domain-containing protein [Occallatibacter savannae]|uniref:HD domain-containing protein n=1 Tax=Occallatibacter savannae TaxID=1002691 RepID=UPI000D687A72|nr:HD domain-containing protein [Occallatibacter savannae]
MPHSLNQPLSTDFDDALRLASVLHREQARKGTQVPYIAHILGVTALVLEYGGTETQAIAALLHDAVEDCGGKPTLIQIEAQFGNDVAGIVESCSDSFEVGPKLGWRERKQAHLEHLRRCDETVLLVTAADKLHNLSAIERDLRDKGPEIWKRFNAEPSDQFWYYDSVLEILESRLGNSIVQSLKDTLERVRITCPYARVARKQDHLNVPMPNARRKLRLNGSFDASEFALVKKGFIPESMDDRWFIFFDPDASQLQIHRSWTGYCIYLLKFRREGSRHEVSQAWVNRDPEQYTEDDPEHDAAVAIYLIDVLLLGKDRGFPSS